MSYLSRGISFNKLHSYEDMNLTLVKIEIETPNKKKIFEEIPFSNEQFDFSEVFGSQCYENRKIICTFNTLEQIEIEYVETLRIKAINWLMKNGRRDILRVDQVPGYYFSGEVVDGINPELVENQIYELVVTFDCYPFKISNEAEGNDIWDIFNFELDIAQTIDYEIKGEQKIVLYNIGANNVSPMITATSNFEITMDNTVYSIKQGVTEDDDFKFKQGEIHLLVKGNGNINFKFYKEML